MKGWHRDSYKHSLARRGVKTHNTYIKSHGIHNDTLFHSTTGKGVLAILNNENLTPYANSSTKTRQRYINRYGYDPEIQDRGIFLSDITEGARVVPNRPFRLHIKIDKSKIIPYKKLRIGGIEGDFWNNWYVTKEFIKPNQILYIEESSWPDDEPINKLIRKYNKLK